MRGANITDTGTYAGSPMYAAMPPDAERRILHARIVIAGQEVMAADQPPGRLSTGKQGFTISLTYPAVADTKNVFAALADGGQILMPQQETFFAERWT